MRGRKPLRKDEWAIVLDFLAHGHHGMERSQPVAYVVGENYFSLLEVIVKDDVHLKLGDRVYIGDGKRDVVKYIRKRIRPDELTAAARDELEDMVTEMVMKNEKKFIDFFNRAGSITTRLHQLELLPGIGKKHLWAIIEARKEKPFESFEDIKKRVPLLPHPEKMVVRRILDEMGEEEKYRLFVPKFEREKERRFR